MKQSLLFMGFFLYMLSFTGEAYGNREEVDRNTTEENSRSMEWEQQKIKTCKRQ